MCAVFRFLQFAQRVCRKTSNIYRRRNKAYIINKIIIRIPRHVIAIHTVNTSCRILVKKCQVQCKCGMRMYP